MCFIKNANHKVSPGLTCFKVMYLNSYGEVSPEFHTELTYKLGDTIHAAEIPNVKLPLKYWFKKEDSRKKVKRQLAIQYIDNWCPDLGGEVVHSFSSEIAARWWKREQHSLVIVECLIPEGEIYWENKLMGQYASFSVQLVKVL